MKTSNRIQRNGATKRAKSQAKIIGSDLPVHSQQIIQEAEEALLELERVGQAATALVMMNALQLKNEGNEFSPGQLDLATHASQVFENDLEPLLRSVAVSVSILRAPKDGMAHPANPFDDEVLMRPWHSIANALTGLSHLINLQDYAFHKQGHHDSGGLSFTVCKRLKAVDQAWDKLFVKLSHAVEKICSHAAQPERMVA